MILSFEGLDILDMQIFSYFLLALNDGEYEVALKCANDANKAIDGHTKKTAHILTLQADSNSLHGYVLFILEGKG